MADKKTNESKKDDETKKTKIKEDDKAKNITNEDKNQTQEPKKNEEMPPNQKQNETLTSAMISTPGLEPALNSQQQEALAKAITTVISQATVLSSGNRPNNQMNIETLLNNLTSNIKALIPIVTGPNHGVVQTLNKVDGIEASNYTINKPSTNSRGYDMPVIRDRDTPNVTKIDLVESNVQPVNEKGFRVPQGFFNYGGSYANSIKIDKFQGLFPVSEPAPLVSMKIAYAFDLYDAPLISSDELLKFHAPSAAVFRNGLQYFTHEFNEAFAKENNLTLHNGLLYLPELQYSSDLANLQNTLSYIAGKLDFIGKIGLYSHFVQSSVDTAKVNLQLNPPYTGQIRPVVRGLGEPTLYKAAYLVMHDSPWVTTTVAEQMANVNYTLGKVSELRIDTRLAISSVYAVDNLDQFTAGLLNYNAKLFLTNRNQVELLKDRMSTYLLPESRIDWDQSSNVLRCYIPPNVPERLQHFVLMFCLCPQAYELIYTYHQQAMTTYLSPNPISEIMFFSNDQTVTPGDRAVQELFEARRAAVRGVSTFERLMLMQIFPPIHHLNVVTDLKHRSATNEIIATFVTLSLFSLYFPVTFMMTIGYVQNWIMGILQYFTNGEAERIKFTGSENRVGYKSDGKGGFMYIRSAQGWIQSYYDDGWLPLLHGLVYFKSDYKGPSGPLMDTIASCFSTVGYWVDDSQEAIEAHPRLCAKHFMPFPTQYSDANSKLSSGCVVRRQQLAKLYANSQFKLNSASLNQATVASIKRVVEKMLGEVVADFNYCLHAHVSHWLRTIANTGMAVIKNFPENVFENPYSTYGLHGRTTSIQLVSGQSSFQSSPTNNIDYNAILPLILQFRTPILKTKDKLASLALGGPSDDLPFKYQNFRAAYLPLFENDEKFFKSMEEVTFLRGLIDLMVIDRAPLSCTEYLVYNEEFDPQGSMFIVSPTQFDQTFSKILSMQGYDEEDLVVLDEAMTVNALEEYLGDDNYPQIYVLTTTVPQDVLGTVINYHEVGRVFVLATDAIAHEVIQHYETVPRTASVGDLVRGIYPDVDIKAIVDPEGRTVNVVGSRWKSMLVKMCKNVNVDGDILNVSTNFGVSISEKMDVGQKVIRRMVEGKIQRFDPAIDPQGLRHYNYGMNERFSQRIKIAQNVLRHKKLPAIHTGIVVVHTQPGRYYFYDKFDISGLINYEFSEALLSFAKDELGNNVPRLLLDGQRYDWDDIVSMISITITLRQYCEVAIVYQNYLKLGISQKKLALTITDYKYTFEIVRLANEANKLETVLPESFSYNIVQHLKFYDMTATLKAYENSPIRSVAYIKCVYPIEELRGRFPVMGFDNSKEMQPSSKIELDGLYDTGIFPQGETTVTHNYFTDDADITKRGDEKTKSISKLSTSNYINVVSESALIDTDFTYNVMEPNYDLTQTV